jgi:hypothetical protein
MKVGHVALRFELPLAERGLYFAKMTKGESRRENSEFL